MGGGFPRIWYPGLGRLASLRPSCQGQGVRRDRSIIFVTSWYIIRLRRRSRYPSSKRASITQRFRPCSGPVFLGKVKALPLYRKALLIREQVLGLDHPSTAHSYNNVAYRLW